MSDAKWLWKETEVPTEGPRGSLCADLFRGIGVVMSQSGEHLSSWRYYLKAPRLGLYEALNSLTYLLKNPYRVQNRYSKRTGRGTPHQYGETPPSVVRGILAAAEIDREDRVLDLGCGRGRFSFWARAWREAQAHGIDEIPTFIRTSSRLTRWMGFDRLSFEEADFEVEGTWGKPTFVYLYELDLEPEALAKLHRRLAWELSPGAIVATVSYSLEEYGSAVFRVIKEIPVRFPWGVTTVFLQVGPDNPNERGSK